MWDYHPHELELDEETDEMETSQFQPTDKYRGGFYFEGNPFGRYLHVMTIKEHKVDTYLGKPRRYNYIVHPLAYRSSLNNIPDNGVDAMQWCILNIKKEANLGPYTPFGECHALEIFNDFTYVTIILFFFNVARVHGIYSLPCACHTTALTVVARIIQPLAKYSTYETNALSTLSIFIPTFAIYN